MKRISALVVLAVCMPFVSFADDIAQAGRAIFDASSNAVATVRLVMSMKMSMPGTGTQEEESVTEVTGTIIGADGLTVVSLFSTDPASALQNFMGSMAGELEGLQIDTRVKELTIVLGDRKEVPGKIVLRDKDLDLAFIRPVQPAAEPFPYVDLAKAGQVQVLDHALVLHRLGKVARRACAGSLSRIEAMVEKPRRTYVLPTETSPNFLGAPVFALDGGCIGMVVQRYTDTTSDTSSGPDMTSVVIPASDIAEVAAKAPMEAEAEPEPVKEEPKAEPKEEQPEASSPASEA